MTFFTATPINADYHYGMLGDFKVIIRTKDSYINVTKLCTDGGKKFFAWKSKQGPQAFLRYFDQTELKEAPPYTQGCPKEAPTYKKGQEFKCIDIINTDSLAGVPSDTAQIIQGTYAHMDVTIYIAQWVSHDFAIRVSKIIRSYFHRELVLEKEQLTTKVADLTALMISAQDENRRMNLSNRVQMDKLHDKVDRIRDDIRECIDILRNDTCSHEIIVMFRDASDPKHVIQIRAGRRDYIMPLLKKCVDVRIYDNIANSKKAIRYAKDKGYLPKNGNSTRYVITDEAKRKQVRVFLRKLNEAYEKDAVVSDVASIHTCEE